MTKSEIEQKIAISIHALRGEGDFNSKGGGDLQRHFNPRPPWGGRRKFIFSSCRHRIISIHALRGEGDNASTNRENSYTDISIHALRGEGDIFSESI